MLGGNDRSARSECVRKRAHGLRYLDDCRRMVELAVLLRPGGLLRLRLIGECPPYSLQYTAHVVLPACETSLERRPLLGAEAAR